MYKIEDYEIPSVPPKSQSNKIENPIISGTLQEGSDMNEDAES